MEPELHVVIASTRPGRIGPRVAGWFADYARHHGHFSVELVDLADFNLPMYNESSHPVMQQYEHDHTRVWAASVASADAFVFVTPEYNFNPPPALVNALNYVYREWNYKPAGFVSYGGVSGGLRAVQSAKQLVTTLKMMPMVESVAMPMVAQLLDEQGGFHSNELIDHSAGQMLDEMAKWADALMPLHRSDAEKAPKVA